jgi:DNA-binding transcriptional LysR family regulator
MEIDYELLKTFVAAARARTFGAAATERRVSVSAISQQIKALETQLGVPLFERIGRGVRLTPAGQSLAGVLQVELGRIDEALERAVTDHAVVRGRVAVGSPRTFGRHWLGPRLPALLSAHPELTVTVEYGVPSVLERRLAEGHLDLVILARPSELPGIDTRPIATETFVAVAAPAYLARHGQPRTPAEFREHRYVVFDPDLAMHAPWWRATFGARAALPEHIVCEVASLEEMMALAIAGAVIAVLPDYQVADAVRAGALRVLEPARGQHARQRPARNTIFLAWRRGAIESARLQAARQALAT